MIAITDGNRVHIGVRNVDDIECEFNGVRIYNDDGDLVFSHGPSPIVWPEWANEAWINGDEGLEFYGLLSPETGPGWFQIATRERFKPVKPWSKEDLQAQVLAGGVTAHSICQAAMGHMDDRATTYDQKGGERSMGKTVTAFNVLTGHSLTEEQGWLLMELLKCARSQQGNYRADNYEDATAYAALRGEAAYNARGTDK